MTPRSATTAAGRRHPGRGLRRRAQRLLVLLVALVLIWLALVVGVVNPLLEALAPRFYRDHTGGTLQFDELFLNPLDLSLRARNVADRRPDGSSLWQVGHLYIAPATLASLTRRALVFDDITVEGVVAELRQVGPDQWNFEPLLGPPTEPPAAGADDAEPAGSLPWIEVRQLRLDLRRVALSAPYLAEPLELTVAGTHLAVRDFSTASGDASRDHLSWTTMGAGPTGLAIDRIDLSLGRDDPMTTHLDGVALYLDHLALAGTDGQPFAFALSDASGGRLYWQGDIAPATERARGQLTLQAIDLAPVWHLLRQRSGLEIASGTLDLRFAYQLDWREALRYQLSDGALTLRQPTVQGAVKETSIALAKLTARGIGLDSISQRVDIARVTLDQPQLRGWNEETEVSLLQLLPAAAEEETEPGAPWSVALAELRLREGQVDWRASQLAEPLRLRAVTLQLDDFTWPATGPAQLALSARLNDTTSLAAAGEIEASALDAALQGEVKQLPLTLANPTLATLLPVTVERGTLDLTWALSVTGGEVARLATSGALLDIELERTDQERRLVAWQRLAWQDAVVEPPRAVATVAGVTLTEPWFRFEINADGTTNLSNLEPVAAAPSSTEAEAEAEAEASASTDADADADADAETAAAQDRPAQPSPDAPAWSFALARLGIENGTLIFADRSLPWPFRARIEAFTGAVTGLSSDPAQPAQVDLRGKLGDYAPVTLAGTVTPLATPPQLDLGLTFSDVDLALLNPYARTYAGYAIDSGLLTVELAYRLEQERIRGSNRVVVRQLTLGEQVESPKAVDLPIRLALALLTDRSGVIDLNVDVTGDLGDPQFGIGKVVRKAFFNAIARVATSPFRFLGRLAGLGQQAAEALDHFDFTPGALELATDEAAKVGAIQRALLERPGLRLHVVGHIDPERDAVALRQEMLRRQLQEEGLSEEALAARAGAWEEAIAALHAKQFPDSPDDLTPAAREEALLDALEPPPSLLQSLALRRAQNLKQLLTTGATPLPTSQVFIDANPQRRDDVSAARATLRLEG